MKKYCRLQHSVARKWLSGQSHNWKRMLVLPSVTCVGAYGKGDASADQVETLKQIIEVKVIKWVKPVVPAWKPNVDGCTKGNPGSSSGGGVLRDHRGDMKMAFAVVFGVTTSNISKAKALLFGVKWCFDNGIN
ncbi:uncharacterized protein LOC132039512 [Lycium ferocissimum]|uniref:uncharacterized protein LOC132039512 n=1 Tax=Lycium ferocissimum TaxID=112874 RepID=UPI00281625B3|nr:uncharacterized protein LOC132039512 [Lycium ferocissimum]